MTILPDNILKCMNPIDRPKGNAGKTREEIQMKHQQKLEKDLQHDILAYLKVGKKIRFVDVNRTDKRTTCKTGTPDFRFVYNGIPIFFEVKRGIINKGDRKGILSPEQIKCMHDMHLDGWRGEVIHSVEEAKEFFDNLDRVLSSVIGAI